MTKPIEDRLTNWARWATIRERRPDADCPTGRLCDRMRKAALGSVWSGHDVRDPIDTADAEVIERAKRTLLKPQRDMLKLHYVQGMRWQMICRRVRVRVDREQYERKLKAAQAAIEKIVNTKGD